MFPPTGKKTNRTLNALPFSKLKSQPFGTPKVYEYLFGSSTRGGLRVCAHPVRHKQIIMVTEKILSLMLCLNSLLPLCSYPVWTLCLNVISPDASNRVCRYGYFRPYPSMPCCVKFIVV